MSNVKIFSRENFRLSAKAVRLGLRLIFAQFTKRSGDRDKVVAIFSIPKYPFIDGVGRPSGLVRRAFGLWRDKQTFFGSEDFYNGAVESLINMAKIVLARGPLPELKAALLFSIGYMHTLLGEYELAIEANEVARDLLEKNPALNAMELLCCDLHLMITYWLSHRHERTLEFAKMARDRADKLGMPVFALLMDFFQARLHVSLGQTEKGLEILKTLKSCELRLSSQSAGREAIL
jgi:hypothetical protein